ncbi:MAG: hypothetical protein R2764_17745 [Bacteroidales bacterium]
MLTKEYAFQKKIEELRERQKELRCLYRIEELMNKGIPEKKFFYELIKLIHNGWQFPEVCQAKITFENKIYKEPGWSETEWVQQAEIVVDEVVSGMIEVYYTEPRKMIIDSPFLPEEQKLLNTISNRIGSYIFNNRLASTISVLEEKIAVSEREEQSLLTSKADLHWSWRKHMTEVLADKLDFDRFEIEGLYLIGSTKNATAGPGSDIDLLIHIKQIDKSLKELTSWIEGWSFCLSEINFQKTGFKTNGLIDLHIITDEDIKNKSSYAVMIGAHTDGARPVKLKK